jgi:tRNA G18 (ribose-2'-O)-methylase SpoU
MLASSSFFEGVFSSMSDFLPFFWIVTRRIQTKMATALGYNSRMEPPAGNQLDGQVLYERQRAHRSRGVKPGPRIAAAGLEMNVNVGAVLRLAEAAGSPEVIFIRETPYKAKSIRRVARNCFDLIRWQVQTQDQFLAGCSSLQPLVALELTTRSVSIFETRLPDAFTLVIGSERDGIPAAILARCQQSVHIPMFGINGSMNVTHALAIALFEWRRQQGG